MGTVAKVLSGVGLLIAAFLVLSHPEQTSSIINSLAQSAKVDIQVLQGR